MSETPDLDAYSLRTGAVAEIDAPVLPYRPPLPSRYRPRIALVGAGGISAAHLAAYAVAGFDVAVICNRTLAKAEARRDEYFPDAEATDDIARTLARDDIAVVDLTPHPAERFGMIETALRAGKHVLSQKPFVLDLDAGMRLCDLADERGLVLAVNQNGRWAPHLAWMREAVAAGLVGDVQSATVAINWNHGWVAGTPFEDIDDLILYDFAVHWFDFVASVLPGPALSVFATTKRAAGQSVRPPMLANAIVSFDGAQASLGFDGASRFGSEDRTLISGCAGTLMSVGPDLSTQHVTLTTEAGVARPKLEGTWFTEGFIGTMGALLQAVEAREAGEAEVASNPPLSLAALGTSPPLRGVEDSWHQTPAPILHPTQWGGGGSPEARRRGGDSAGTSPSALPLNAARTNLRSLALVLAAIASARRGVPMEPGTVRTLAAAQE